MNQCDGCQSGLPLEGNLHKGGNSFFVCTAYRYVKKIRPTKEQEARARYIFSRGWLVEQQKDGEWVRVYERLTKHEAFWIAYGEQI